MAVIARRRTEPLYRVELAPRLFRVQQAVRIGLGNGIVHQCQGRIAADEAFLRPASQQLRPEFLRAAQSGQLTVVAGVHTVHDAVLRRRQDSQNVGDHVQLRLARLAARHIQLQILLLQRLKFRLDGGIFLFQFFRCAILISSAHLFSNLSTFLFLAGLFYQYTIHLEKSKYE